MSQRPYHNQTRTTVCLLGRLLRNTFWTVCLGQPGRTVRARRSQRRRLMVLISQAEG